MLFIIVFLALSLPVAANSLTNTDQDAIDALSRRGQVLVRDILDALRGASPNTNAHDCLDDIEQNAERVGNIIEETATLTQISVQMIDPVDESTVNEVIGILTNRNQGILSIIRNAVNYTTGLCTDYAAVAAYSREVVNLMSEYATISRRISVAIGRRRRGSAVRK
jgi:hypothetical protein